MAAALKKQEDEEQARKAAMESNKESRVDLSKLNEDVGDIDDI